MRQHLIIGVDDTRLQNNVYFERAFDDSSSSLPTHR
jgi:hypothetical protein